MPKEGCAAEGHYPVGTSVSLLETLISLLESWVVAPTERVSFSFFGRGAKAQRNECGRSLPGGANRTFHSDWVVRRRSRERERERERRASLGLDIINYTVQMTSTSYQYVP